MELFRRLMPSSSDGQWRTVNENWEVFKHSCILWDSSDLSPVDRKDWNPWEFWCKSWRKYASSGSKPPKSGKKKITFWRELDCMAQYTSGKLEEAKATRKKLKQQATTILNLEKEKKDLETACGHLQTQLDIEQQNKIKHNQIHIEMMKKEELRRKSIEEDKIFLQKEVEQKNAELLEVAAQLKQLEWKLFDLQFELENMKANSDHPQDPNCTKGSKEFEPDSRLPAVVNRPVDLETIRHMSDLLGEINSNNAVDWLCDCEDLGKAWHWHHFGVILHNCMDPSTFSSLSNKVKTGQATWLAACREVLDMLNPGWAFVHDMEEDSSVLQFFCREWLLYRVQNATKEVSKTDLVYRLAIYNGLPPYFREEIDPFGYDNFEQLQKHALLVEDSWWDSQERKQKMDSLARKAGAGCPSRYKIWKKLENYINPCLTLDNAPYWELLVELSKHEELQSSELM
ncbi:uncharacterized protein [Hyperolius riggenbachi]|uniref:uncharacterized protein n=1 Tax=Hyperolius riggenbachi TaxID=752182 RepID=UPI0035A395FF